MPTARSNPTRRPPRPSSRAALALALCITPVALLAGCAGNNSSGGILGALLGESEPEQVTASSLPGDTDEPMSLFEKRRLIARVQQDPRTVQRLTVRERRELAAMIKATRRDED